MKVKPIFTVIFLFIFFIILPNSVQGGTIKDIYDILNDIQKQLRQNYDKKVDEYQKKLVSWAQFSPQSRSLRPMGITLRPLDRINLEDGWASGVKQPGVLYDLVYVTGSGGIEILRAENGVYWHLRGVAHFESIIYREIRDAQYYAPKNQRTGYPDLFYSHRSNVPPVNTVFFVRTKENNVAKVQILNYINEYYGNQVVSRNIRIKFEVFPIVSDPPKPVPPKELSAQILDKIMKLLY